MGSFYTNITLKGADLEATLGALDGRRAFAAAIGPDVLVFDEACEEQDVRLLAALCEELSRALHCAAIAVLNHDDDVLLVYVYQDGARVTDYDSCPGYFSGEDSPPSQADVTALCASLGASSSRDRVAAILAAGFDEFAFATERHEALSSALGLPQQAVGSGYLYILQGELPLGLGDVDLTRVGGDV
jgi:hypothetical protein